MAYRVAIGQPLPFQKLGLRVLHLCRAHPHRTGEGKGCRRVTSSCAGVHTESERWMKTRHVCDVASPLTSPAPRQNLPNPVQRDWSAGVARIERLGPFVCGYVSHTNRVRMSACVRSVPWRPYAPSLESPPAPGRRGPSLLKVGGCRQAGCRAQDTRRSGCCTSLPTSARKANRLCASQSHDQHGRRRASTAVRRTRTQCWSR